MDDLAGKMRDMELALLKTIKSSFLSGIKKKILQYVYVQPNMAYLSSIGEALPQILGGLFIIFIVHCYYSTCKRWLFLCRQSLVYGVNNINIDI